MNCHRRPNFQIYLSMHLWQHFGLSSFWKELGHFVNYLWVNYGLSLACSGSWRSRLEVALGSETFVAGCASFMLGRSFSQRKCFVFEQPYSTCLFVHQDHIHIHLHISVVSNDWLCDLLCPSRSGRFSESRPWFSLILALWATESDQASIIDPPISTAPTNYRCWMCTFISTTNSNQEVPVSWEVHNDSPAVPHYGYWGLQTNIVHFIDHISRSRTSSQHLNPSIITNQSSSWTFLRSSSFEIWPGSSWTLKIELTHFSSFEIWIHQKFWPLWFEGEVVGRGCQAILSFVLLSIFNYHSSMVLKHSFLFVIPVSDEVSRWK